MTEGFHYGAPKRRPMPAADVLSDWQLEGLIDWLETEAAYIREPHDCTAPERDRRAVEEFLWSLADQLREEAARRREGHLDAS